MNLMISAFDSYNLSSLDSQDLFSGDFDDFSDIGIKHGGDGFHEDINVNEIEVESDSDEIDDIFDIVFGGSNISDTKIGIEEFINSIII